MYLGFHLHIGAPRPNVFTSEQEADAEQTTMVVDTNADLIEQLQDKLTSLNVNQH
jgi:hypothetical protein